MRKNKYIRLALALLLSLCLWGSSQAGWLVRNLTVGGADYCSSCTPGDPTDQVCEDSDGTETIETGATDWTTARCTDAFWTQQQDTGATLFEAAHSGALSCAGKGDYALQFYVVDASDDESENNFIRREFADTKTMYAQAYVNIVSEAIDDLNDEFSLITITNQAPVRLASCRIVQTSGDLHLSLEFLDSGAQEDKIDGTTVLSTGTWYRIGLEWDDDNTAICYLNGVAEATNVDTPAATNADRVYFGTRENQTTLQNDPVTFQMDIMGADDDTMPGACS